MSHTRFCIEVVKTKRVLGHGVGDTPEAFESTLGPEYLDDGRKKLLRRDYGLVEIYFESKETSWICTGFTVQTHRLSYENTRVVPRPLEEQYGEFPQVIEWSPLRRSLEDAQYAIIPDEIFSSEERGCFHLGDRATIHTLHKFDSSPEAIWSIQIV